MTPSRPARNGILILGGGFAGAYVARLLGRRGATIISPENFMLYTPMLPEAASGTLEPRHVVVPLRMMCPYAELLLGRAVGLDEASRTVAVATDAGSFDVAYEQLVLALGSVPRTLPIPGLAEHGLGFKNLADAIHLRNHVLRELEAADAALVASHAERHLTFVFVGAGYAGVEALAEIPTRLSEYAARQLTGRGIDIRVGTTLESVEGDSLVLSDGSRLETHTLVWTAGVRAHPLLAELGLLLDERGRVRVDDILRVEGCGNIWALGDCARVLNAATPDHPDPPTSQHALRQARRLAKNLQGAPRPYRYRMRGMVATLGRHKGVGDVLGLRLRGFLGWFATRTYHLYQLPLASRKLRVVTDWTVSLFFRRDIAELSMLGHARGLSREGHEEDSTISVTSGTRKGEG